MRACPAWYVYNSQAVFAVMVDFSYIQITPFSEVQQSSRTYCGSFQSDSFGDGGTHPHGIKQDSL